MCLRAKKWIATVQIGNRQKEKRKKAQTEERYRYQYVLIYIYTRARFTTAQNDEHGCRSKNVKNVFSHSD